MQYNKGNPWNKNTICLYSLIPPEMGSTVDGAEMFQGQPPFWMVHETRSK